jgi:DNA repair protein RadC
MRYRTVANLQMKTLDALYDWFVGEVNIKGNEQYGIVCIDRDHNVLHSEVVAVGDESCVKVDPKKVFRTGLKTDGCSALLTIHNHPNGKRKQSSHDINLAGRLSSLGRKLCMPVCCHVIALEEGYVEYGQRFNQ